MNDQHRDCRPEKAPYEESVPKEYWGTHHGPMEEIITREENCPKDAMRATGAEDQREIPAAFKNQDQTIDTLHKCVADLTAHLDDLESKISCLMVPREEEPSKERQPGHVLDPLSCLSPLAASIERNNRQVVLIRHRVDQLNHRLIDIQGRIEF